MAGIQQLSTPVIGSSANQPRQHRFPQREFGKTSVVKRSFQQQWFDRWPWLHYCEEKDLAFCFSCISVYQNNQLQAVHCLEKSFISTGFSNWKDTVAKFNKHEGSRCHKDAVLATVTLPAATRDISKLLSTQLAKERSERRKCFLKLLSNVRFLSRQGLAFRGDGNESDSNFMQLHSEDDSRPSQWIMQKTDKYTSGEMQNEMIKVMALCVLRKISAVLQKCLFLTVMVDETTDVSNTEQVVICIRYVDEHFEVHEEFVGLFEVASTRAENIFTAITDVFLRLNIPLSKVRGQCYDRAAAMCGSRSGVVTRLCAVEPRAVFTHFYGHSLNLACSDAIKQCKLMQDALDTSYEIIKLIKKSPGREAIFKKLKAEMDCDSPTPGIRVLCPTRWTVRAASLKSIIDNFEILIIAWEVSLERVKDTEMKARIQGVASQMMKFDFYFGISLGLLIMRHTDNLSKTMQRADMSAAEGQGVTSMTVTTLKSLRNNANFNLYWKKTTDAAANLNVSEPALPRRRKAPRRFDEGSTPTFHETVEDH